MSVFVYTYKHTCKRDSLFKLSVNCLCHLMEAGYGWGVSMGKCESGSSSSVYTTCGVNQPPTLSTKRITLKADLSRTHLRFSFVVSVVESTLHFFHWSITDGHCKKEKPAQDFSPVVSSTCWSLIHMRQEKISL